jgi:hypothetical protein
MKMIFLFYFLLFRVDCESIHLKIERMTEYILKSLKPVHTMLMGVCFEPDVKNGNNWKFQPWNMEVEETKVKIGASMHFQDALINDHEKIDMYRLDWSVHPEGRREMPYAIRVSGSTITFIGEMMDVEALACAICGYSNSRTITSAWANSGFCSKLEFTMCPNYLFKVNISKSSPGSDVLYTVLSVVKV